MTTTDRSPSRDQLPGSASLRTTQRRVLGAEAIKVLSLRSTRWLAVISALSIMAAGVSPALVFLLAPDDPAAQEQGVADATGGALSGISFTQLLIAALGVLIVSSEYTTGLVRATFTAVPTRLPVLWAKAAVGAVIAMIATLLAVFGAFFTAQAVLSGADVTVSLSEPGVARALLGSALYMAVTAVLGVAFGALLRSALGGMAAVFGLLFLTPLLGLLVPSINSYLPTSAGGAILQTEPMAGVLSPWAGLGVFSLYAVAALVTAALLLIRRDA